VTSHQTLQRRSRVALDLVALRDRPIAARLPSTTIDRAQESFRSDVRTERHTVRVAPRGRAARKKELIMYRDTATSIVRIALASLACSLGCMGSAQLGADTGPRKPAPLPEASDDNHGCGPAYMEISKNHDLRMKCIQNGDGSSDHVGESFTFTCPSFEVNKFVWVNGSDPFPLSSSVCYSAAYVGRIDPQTGGRVKLQIVEPRTDYPAGEVKSGIKSQKNTPPHPVPGFTFVD
jgi:hypothetical protein